jgi:DNA repair exonuclease SbcCD ATPase subunit
MAETSDILLARLAEGLDSTAKMTQALLSDLRESEADFASMKTELSFLKENVKGLSELVRDGGTSSILTRVALIEQNIDNIKKWMDNHVDVHQRVKKEFTNIKAQISELEKRLSSIEGLVNEIEKDNEEQERVSRINMDREIELAHERKKTDEKVRAERQEAIVKIVAAIVIGAVGLIGGYLANSCIVRDNAGVSAPITSGSAQTPPDQTDEYLGPDFVPHIPGF